MAQVQHSTRESMPESDTSLTDSDTPLIDYYPSGWNEEIHSPEYIEWVYADDPTILVRLEVDEQPPNYYVSAITGVTDQGDEHVATVVSDLSVKQAFDVAQGFVYALNGALSHSEE